MPVLVHKSLRHHRIISASSFFLLSASFALFLLVALSLPIIKDIYLFTLEATLDPNLPSTNIGTQLRFGVWGVCVNSALNIPTLLHNTGECIGPQLGYSIPVEYLNLLGVSTSLVNALLKGLEILLVLHPVAAGLSLLTLLQALFLGHHGISICALIMALLTAIVSSVTLAADIALVIVARSKVKDLTIAQFGVNFGNGVWMVAAAVALIWITVVFLSARACYCLGVRKHGQESTENDEDRY
ncbi:hypothetical protein PILCRDRAFT_820423 [Piloderma croceum F 1598]|uniref:Pali-domain-containing protein n=1 Tax=Piloderma croceum (strain F 1598) TaxID=765440 RepID=A0A0C3FCZ2_PILCF|nr:hypothetical protein PILCRDRAFT_820423 [Piloderma croceum F 1598]